MADLPRIDPGAVHGKAVHVAVTRERDGGPAYYLWSRSDEPGGRRPKPLEVPEGTSLSGALAIALELVGEPLAGNIAWTFAHGLALPAEVPRG